MVRSRPRCITVIGGLAVVMGALGVATHAPQGWLAFALRLSWLWESSIVGVLQTALAAAAVVGGVFLLRLRPWARTLVEAIAWCALLAVTSAAAVWLYAFIPALVASPSTEGSRMFVVLSTLFVGIPTLITLILAVVVIRALRSRAVRDAVLPRVDAPSSAGA